MSATHTISSHIATPSTSVHGFSANFGKSHGRNSQIPNTFVNTSSLGEQVSVVGVDPASTVAVDMSNISAGLSFVSPPQQIVQRGKIEVFRTFSSRHVLE